MSHSKNAPQNDRISAGQTIKVLREEASVDKRKVVTGEVQVVRESLERETNIPVTTRRSNITETRIPRHEEIDEIPAVRTEGNTTIIPVVREEAVVIKRLILVEEIHLTRTVESDTEDIPVTLREDSVSIHRT